LVREGDRTILDGTPRDRERERERERDNQPVAGRELQGRHGGGRSVGR